MVKLIIYDISGKEIIRLIDGNISEGNHSIIFNGQNLPSGIYFAKLTAGKQESIIKMVLAK